MEIRNSAAQCRHSSPAHRHYSDDVIWYGDYDRGYLGSYDPKTGSTEMAVSQRAALRDLRHHGVRTTSSGTTSLASDPNPIVRFDPKTEKFQSWAIPSGGGVVRI